MSLSVFKPYFTFMVAYVILFSALELIKNKHYNNSLKRQSLFINIKIILLLLIHTAVYVAIYFTFPFLLYNFNKIKVIYFIMYLGLLILVPLHWYTNANKCWSTVTQNKLLGISEDVGFRDFISIILDIDTESGTLKEMTLRDKLYYGYLISSLVIVFLSIIYKLTYKN